MAGNLNEVSRLLPTKIEQTFDQPKVRELMQEFGGSMVTNQIEFELLNLANLMSVGGNLNDAQIQFIAAQLIDLYPTESLADFKICFQRGAMGTYGNIQRMDGITIREWMAKYLEEKYMILEDKLMQEKDDLYKTPQLTEGEREHLNRIDIDGMLNEYKESIKHFESRAILPMSQKEIELEGQVEPRRKVYLYDETEAGILLMEHHKVLFAAQEKAIRERHPELSEQEIANRCADLQAYTIQEETKPKFCTDIGKIWEKKNNFKGSRH